MKTVYITIDKLWNYAFYTSFCEIGLHTNYIYIVDELELRVIWSFQ